MAKITLVEYDNMRKCSCILYIALFSIMFTISIRIGTFFVYYKYMNHDKKGSIFQTAIYWTYKDECKKDKRNTYLNITLSMTWLTSKI